MLFHSTILALRIMQARRAAVRMKSLVKASLYAFTTVMGSPSGTMLRQAVAPALKIASALRPAMPEMVSTSWREKIF